jgi:hypothetical protein
MVEQALIDDLIEKMESERAALLEVLTRIDERAASVSPPEGDGELGWSVKEQLAHLASMDRGYRQWVRRAVAEDAPNVSDGRTVTDPMPIPLEDANDAPLGDLVEQMTAERVETMQLAASLAPEQFDRLAKQEFFGELSVLQWLRSYYRHDRMHRAQIQGEQSEYRPRFADGAAEPRSTRPAEG